MLLCLLATGVTLGQESVKKAAPGKAAVPALKQKSSAQSAGNAKIRKNVAGPRATPSSRRSKRTAPALPMNPDAKWSCENLVVDLPPVWRGKDILTFPFKIKNEGTADLLIRAKGG